MLLPGEVRSDQVTAVLSEELPREVSGLRCIRGAARETSRIFEEISPRHKIKPHWGKKKGTADGPREDTSLQRVEAWKPMTSGNSSVSFSTYAKLRVSGTVGAVLGENSEWVSQVFGLVPVLKKPSVLVADDAPLCETEESTPIIQVGPLLAQNLDH